MKPPGIEFLMTANGVPRMRVTQSDRITDKIWDAVEAATLEGWSPERFRDECKDAWREARRRQVDEEPRRL